MISQHDINRILNCASIEQVVARYISLRKRGRSYIGLCPFHPDKHPSFHVSPSKKLCKCFSCNAGGNVISFVINIEKCTFQEAIHIISGICNIPVAIGIQAQQYLLPALKPKPDGVADATHALPPPPEVVQGLEDFLGTLLPYNPNHPELNEVYKQEGTGLAPYSVLPGFGAFRNRIIFPLRNADGVLIGVAGRAVQHASPKYINPPASAWYHKRGLLYNFAAAREWIALYNTCFVVEGYKDALAMRAADAHNVVALAGTALTPEQILLLKTVASHIILALDGDAPGRKASLLCQTALEAAGLECTVIDWGDGLDPDSFFCLHGKTQMTRFLIAQFLACNKIQLELPATHLLRFVLTHQNGVVHTPQGIAIALPAYVMQVLDDEGMLFTHTLHTELLEWLAKGVPHALIPDISLQLLANALCTANASNPLPESAGLLNNRARCRVYEYIVLTLSHQLAQLLAQEPAANRHCQYRQINELLEKRERITKMTELCSVG